MRKILLLATISVFFIQCNKKTKTPELASDNDYEMFDLKDRVCKIDQKITLLTKSNYTIEEKNAVYYFSPEGYLIADSIYNNSNHLVETNSYEKFKIPLTKKQFISGDNFTLNETKYDSLKNIIHFKKTTSKNQIIEEQKNTFSNNLIIREDFYISGNGSPKKIIHSNWKNNLLVNKVYLNQQHQILDSVAYEYNDKHQLIGETHYNSKKTPTNLVKTIYEGDKVIAVAYFDGNNKEEAIEKFAYNNKNLLIYKLSNSAFDNSTYEETHEYNEINKLIKSITKLNGKIILSSIYGYDDKGNLNSLRNENLTSKENFNKTITYTYDTKGNWLTKEISFNNVPTFKVSRTIKYCK